MVPHLDLFSPFSPRLLHIWTFRPHIILGQQPCQSSFSPPNSASRRSLPPSFCSKALPTRLTLSLFLLIPLGGLSTLFLHPPWPPIGHFDLFWTSSINVSHFGLVFPSPLSICELLGHQSCQSSFSPLGVPSFRYFAPATDSEAGSSYGAIPYSFSSLFPSGDCPLHIHRGHSSLPTGHFDLLASPFGWTFWPAAVPILILATQFRLLAFPPSVILPGFCPKAASYGAIPFPIHSRFSFSSFPFCWGLSTLFPPSFSPIDDLTTPWAKEANGKMTAPRLFPRA